MKKYIMVSLILLLAVFASSVLFGTAPVPTNGDITNTYSASLDGYVLQSNTYGNGKDWSGITGASGSGNGSAESTIICYIRSDGIQDKWRSIYKGLFKFNITDLPPNAIVTSMTVSLYGSSKADGLNCNPQIGLYPVEIESITPSLYGLTEDTLLSNQISFSDWSYSGYNNFTLNQSGLDYINSDKRAEFAIRSHYDATNTSPSWVASKAMEISAFYRTASVKKVPKMTLTYTMPEAGYYTIAVLPDTQGIARYYPAMFEAQTQWIADNKEAENIVFVAHVGDIVNDAWVTAQWQNAKKAMDTLSSANVTYSVLPGNHDIDGSSYASYNQYFPGNGQSYPEGTNQNSYHLLSAGGQDLLILNIGVFTSPEMRDAVYQWADGVLTQYAGRMALVVTHGLIDAEGNLASDQYLDGQHLWDNLFSNHANIKAVFCGHFHTYPGIGESHIELTGDAGNKVHVFLANYQSATNYGSGMFRLYKFYGDTIEVKTFCPAHYVVDADSEFTVGID